MRDGNIIRGIFENPALIKNLSMAKIDAWIAETPYVQYLHLLKALKLKSENVNDIKAYHMSATVANDRIRMNELLDSLESNETMVENNLEREKEVIKPKKEKKKKEKSSKKNKAIHDKNQITDTPQGISAASSSKNHEELIEEIIEESLEDWDSYIETSNNKEDNSDSSESKAVTEPIETKKSDSEIYKSKSELSEFSDWLLALEGKNEEINKEQIDQSVSIEGAAISETLAKLMEMQGHTDKAIEMYEKLVLIYPEKSAYFAALIDKLKKQ